MRTLPRSLHMPGQLLCMLMVAASLRAAEFPASTSPWTQWGGPAGSGTALNAGKLVWPLDWMPTRWQTPVGAGGAESSGVAALDGRVYTLGADEKGVEAVVALKALGGAVLWKKALPATAWKDAAITADARVICPAATTTAVFVVGRRGSLVALKPDDGATIWSKDLAAEWKLAASGNAFALSPMVIGSAVIVGNAAFDAADGKPLWDLGGRHLEATPPALCPPAAKSSVALVPQSNLVLVDVGSGKVTASADLAADLGLTEKDHVWTVTTDGGILAVANTKAVFYSADAGKLARGAVVDLPSPVAQQPVTWKGRALLPLANSGSVAGGVVCVDVKSGKTLWKSETATGSALVAGDKLVLWTSQGELLTYSLSDLGAEERSRTLMVELKKEEAISPAPLALADGRLYLRAKDQLTCFYLRPEWNGWRGNKRNFVSEEEGIAWSTKAPKQAWKILGSEMPLDSWSSMACSEGKLFTGRSNPASKHVEIVCLDAATGKQIWAAPFPNREPQTNYTQWTTFSSPALDDLAVYLADTECHVLKCNRETGAILWMTDLKPDYIKTLQYGLASSPLLLGKTVIVSDIGLDRETGKVLWNHLPTPEGRLSSVSLGKVGAREVALSLADKAIIDFVSADGEKVRSLDHSTGGRCMDVTTVPTAFHHNQFVMTTVQWADRNLWDVNGGGKNWERIPFGVVTPFHNGYVILSSSNAFKDPASNDKGGENSTAGTTSATRLEYKGGDWKVTPIWSTEGKNGIRHNIVVGDKVVMVSKNTDIMLADLNEPQYKEIWKLENACESFALGERPLANCPIYCDGKVYLHHYSNMNTKLPVKATLVCYDLTEDGKGVPETK